MLATMTTIMIDFPVELKKRMMVVLVAMVQAIVQVMVDRMKSI